MLGRVEHHQLSLADGAWVAYTRWAHKGGFDLEPNPSRTDDG